MPNPPLSREEALRTIAAVEDALRKGHKPPGITLNAGEMGAITAAALALGVPQSTFQGRLKSTGSIFRKHTDLKVNWDLYQAPQAEEQDLDRFAKRDEVLKLRQALKESHRAALDDVAIKRILGILGDTPANPPEWVTRIPARSSGNTPEVPVTIWSDWHLGENVSREELLGANEYSIEIAEARVRRLVDSTINICANHGPGHYPGIVINLLGDFISGGLHPELAKTDEEEVIPAALRARDLLVAALTRMADTFGKVYCPCASGNHGRGTAKPEFKRYVYQNFDWLIYQLLIRHFEGDERVQIDVRPANEIHYRVYGQRYLAMHGDMMGVRGGDGIIGVIGPIMRGEVKTRGQSSTIGLDYDVLLMGHWHQQLWLPRAIVSNTLKGWDEYAKNSLRAPPSDPSQPLWFVHPNRGITSRWEVKVEDTKQKSKEWVSWAA